IYSIHYLKCGIINAEISCNRRFSLNCGVKSTTGKQQLEALATEDALRNLLTKCRKY
ncbi:hypothetical protein L9F63_012483, partial [Diploptera punctata]